MCIAAPGKVIHVRGKQADVDYGGGIVHTAYIADSTITVGDWVLVQMGIIIKVLDESQYTSISAHWDTRDTSRT